jgi:hypothetical protein
MEYKKGDFVRLGPYVHYVNGDHPSQYQQGKFTEGLVVGRFDGKPEIIFANFRNDPSLFSGGIETMFSDFDLELLPASEKDRIIDELIDKDYKIILEEKNLLE